MAEVLSVIVWALLSQPLAYCRIGWICHSRVFALCCRRYQLNVYLVSDDHSRVRLAVIEGVDGSDYINANFISVLPAF